MPNDKLLQQAEVINRAHAMRACVQFINERQEAYAVQRWRGYLGEYEVPRLAYPMLTVISGGRARIQRVHDRSSLSMDYAMPGDVALVPRGEPMRWRVNGEMDITAITFRDERLCDHLQRLHDSILSAGEEINTYVGGFGNAYLFTNCAHLTNVLAGDEEADPDYIDVQVRSLALYILNYLGRGDNGLRGRQHHSPQVGYAIKRLSLGLANKILIEEIAAELQVSAAYLTKRFKQEMGVTPHQFLLLKRIKRAKSLLANTDMELVNIAMDCGFSHQSHFTRHFSRVVGVSPLKFRQHVRCQPRLDAGAAG